MLNADFSLARGYRWNSAAALLGLAILALPLAAHAVQEDEPKTDAPELEVVLKREALKLTDPRTYRVSMHLDAVRTLELTAPVDGYVRSITAKPGQKIKAQSEVLRLDDTKAALLLKRAKANLHAAQIEKKLSQARNDADQLALAEARFEAAQADADVAQFDAEQLIVRGPFNGELQRVEVVEGQFVRAGEKLATLIDPSRLQVEIPLDRAGTAAGSNAEIKSGSNVDIKVEETQVKARIEALMALASKFDPLRELTVSPVSALVSIDNSAGKFFAGQTVYSDLIPLAPVAVVPAECISNAAEGRRKVQVLRDNVIRDLAVRILAKIGTDSVFISGRFNDGDEVIVSSSRQLTDGTPLRALAAGESAAPAAGTGKPPGRGRGPGKTPVTKKPAAEGF
jgi:multidrug efflux system membrane fusion protein